MSLSSKIADASTVKNRSLADHFDITCEADIQRTKRKFTFYQSKKTGLRSVYFHTKELGYKYNFKLLFGK